MAELNLSAPDRKRLVDLIVTWAGIGTSLARLTLLDSAGLLGDEVGVVGRLNIEGAARDFASQTVRELQRRGTLASIGQPALVPLLRELREIVRGHEDEAAFLDQLLAPYRPGGALAPAAAIDERPLKLFVSYRRRSWAFTQRLADDLRGFGSRFIDLKGPLAQAEAGREAAQCRAEALVEYGLIARLARSAATVDTARSAWPGFREANPEFDDPEGLDNKLRPPEPADTPDEEPAADRIGAEEPPDAGSSGMAKVAEFLTGMRTKIEVGPSRGRAMVLVGLLTIMVGIAFIAQLGPETLLSTMLDPLQPPTSRAWAGRRLAQIGDPRPGVGLRPDGLPDILETMCRVEAGAVVIENGVGHRSVEPFQIATYEITFAQYKSFLDAEDGYRNTRWWEEPVRLALRQEQPGRQEWSIANHPAENVSWYDAVAFTRWLTDKLRDELPPVMEIRLPTEAEWQLAAGGPGGKTYPWGEEYEVGRGNVDESRLNGGTFLGRTTAVGLYPDGRADCGALDMAGNVSEWTATAYDDGRDGDLRNDRPRVVRGGSWVDFPTYARAARRSFGHPFNRFRYDGFRVVLAAPVQ